MDLNLRGNLRYMIEILFCFLLLPEIPVFCMAHPFTTVVWPFIYLYILFVWMIMPFSAGIISVRHVLARDKFSPILVGEAALCLGIFLFSQRNLLNSGTMMVLSISVGVFLVTECFALLGLWEARHPEGSSSRLLDGLAKNRKYLALVFWGSVSTLVALQQLMDYLLMWQLTPLPLLLIWLPPVMLVLALIHVAKGVPLTLGGLVGLVPLCAVSLLLSSQRNLTLHWQANLFWTGLGYGLLLLVEGIAALWRMYRRRA